MSQFKRFNTSDNTNWNNDQAYPEGTLTWDQNNGLRLHDGNTSYGNPIGDTGYTTFNGDGIGNRGPNNMTISPNWDGQFTGSSYVIIPETNNADGNSLQLVNNRDGGIQLVTKNNATWTFDKDGALTLPAGGSIKDSAGNIAFVSLSTLKQIVADSADFIDFKTRIAVMQ